MIATVPSMIGQFNMDNLNILLKLGYEVHVACNFDDVSVWSSERIEKFKKQLDCLNIKWIQVDFARSPYRIDKLVKAYRQVKKLIRKEKYIGVHCHTPVAGLVTRFASRNNELKVIYTAHGFHFYKGAPIKNWLIYYPIEKICSYMTDVLIVINKEDYTLAQKKMKAREVVYIPGVGVNTEKYRKVEDDTIRKEFGIPNDAQLLLSVGELNKNKNHEIVIKAISELEKPTSLYYIIVGKGERESYLKKLIEERKLERNIFLVGFRTDVLKFYCAADIYVFPSFREGLSVALMEAMACGLPVIASDIRGNRDLIDREGGMLVSPRNVVSVEQAVKNVLDRNKSELFEMSKYNINKITEFSSKVVKEKMKTIYTEIGIAD